MLTRDTSLYPPFMQSVRSRRYRRKLSALVEEHLGYKIQQRDESPFSSIILKSYYDNHRASSELHDMTGVQKNDGFQESKLGHSSIEDATAALLLYSKFSYNWEQSLHFPLRRYYRNHHTMSYNDNKNISLFIDGCNVPIGLRRRRFQGDHQILHSHASADELRSVSKDIGSIYTNYQLVSTLKARIYTNSSHSVSTCLVDWAPIIRPILLNSSSLISKVRI